MAENNFQADALLFLFLSKLQFNLPSACKAGNFARFTSDGIKGRVRVKPETRWMKRALKETLCTVRIAYKSAQKQTTINEK